MVGTLGQIVAPVINQKLSYILDSHDTNRTDPSASCRSATKLGVKTSAHTQRATRKRHADTTAGVRSERPPGEPSARLVHRRRTVRPLPVPPQHAPSQPQRRGAHTQQADRQTRYRPARRRYLRRWPARLAAERAGPAARGDGRADSERRRAGTQAGHGEHSQWRRYVHDTRRGGGGRQCGNRLGGRPC